MTAAAREVGTAAVPSEMIWHGRSVRLHHVAQGDCVFGFRPDDLLATLLGSCISVCVRDPSSGHGGMNHFLIPRSSAPLSDLKGVAMRFGSYAIERLVNRLIARGASRDTLEFKLFGGANMHHQSLAIGAQNADFVEQFMAEEGFRVTASDLRGTQARKIRFLPSTGQVWLKRIGQPDRDLLRQEMAMGGLQMLDRMKGDVTVF